LDHLKKLLGYQVDFSAMKQTKRLILTHVDELDADVIELPYENDALSMIVVVPSDDADIKKVSDKLEDFNIVKIDDKLGQVRARIVLFCLAP